MYLCGSSCVFPISLAVLISVSGLIFLFLWFYSLIVYVYFLYLYISISLLFLSTSLVVVSWLLGAECLVWGIGSKVLDAGRYGSAVRC